MRCPNLTVKYYLLIKTVFMAILYLFFSTGFTFTARAAVKIAIIGDDGLESFTDIVTASLSDEKGINLFERTVIEKIFKEQQIILSSSDTDYRKIGKLINVEGLIILRKLSLKQKDFIVSKLIAVNTGVIIGITLQPLPVEKPMVWLNDLKNRFVPLIPKLIVPSKEAVPVSILNIRSPVNSLRLKLLEKELTLSLALRLMQEKEIFILERWKMGKLIWEKDLNPEESNPFWTGSYLLDGSIESKGKKLLKVLIRLKKPDGTEIIIEESGKYNQLKALIKTLTSKILKEIGKKTQQIKWNPKIEAEQYFKEARWAIRAGLYHVAEYTADASWALGKKDVETIYTKIQAYSFQASHQFLSKSLVQYYIQTPESYYFLTQKRLNNRHTLDYTIKALELFPAFAKLSQKTENKLLPDNSSWICVGPKLVSLSVAVLISFINNEKRFHENTDQLQYLQQLTKKALQIIERRPSVLTRNYYKLKMLYTPCFYDSPEKQVKEYVALLNKEFKYLNNKLKGEIRQPFNNSDFKRIFNLDFPWYFNWSTGKVVKSRKYNAMLYNMLDKTTSLQKQADHCFISLSLKLFPADETVKIRDKAKNILEELIKNRKYPGEEIIFQNLMKLIVSSEKPADKDYIISLADHIISHEPLFYAKNYTRIFKLLFGIRINHDLTPDQLKILGNMFAVLNKDDSSTYSILSGLEKKIHLKYDSPKKLYDRYGFSPPKKKNCLIVNKFWHPWKNDLQIKMPRIKKINVLYNRMKVKKGLLHTITDGYCYLKKGIRRYFFFSVDLNSLETRQIAEISENATLSDIFDADKRNFLKQTFNICCSRDRHSPECKILWYDGYKTRYVKVPNLNYKFVLPFKDSLIIYNEQSFKNRHIYKVDTSNSNIEVLASSRRHPAKSPLDE